MATVFYLPRILVNIAEAGDGQTPEAKAVRARLTLMGRRLYGFGHTMFGIAVVLGTVLWLHFGIGGGWMHAKLALVAALLAYYIVAGRWLKGVDAGKSLPSPTANSAAWGPPISASTARPSMCSTTCKRSLLRCWPNWAAAA